MTNSPSIPVHVLSGFLGSGKTTILNKLIKSEAMANAAVIINEFGEVGLDHHLVEGSSDAIVELSNGCLCCTVRGQLVDTLEELTARKPSHILIETTGLADPVPVLQAVMASPSLSGQIALAGLITVFDALHGAKNISEHREAREQVALADTIVITKLDQINPPDPQHAIASITHFLQAQNPTAAILTKNVFFEDSDAIMRDRSAGAAIPRDADQGSHLHHHHHEHDTDINRHSDRIQTVTLRHEAPVKRANLEMFLDLLLSAHGDHVLRLKGLASIEGDNRPLLLQAVHRTLSPPEFLDLWPSPQAHTELVVFLQDMKPEFVRRLFHGFLDIPATDTPDRQAMQSNPLAIPGTGNFKPG